MKRTYTAHGRANPGLQRQADPGEPVPPVPVVIDHHGSQAINRQDRGHREDAGRDVPYVLHPQHRRHDQPQGQQAPQVDDNPGTLDVPAQEW